MKRIFYIFCILALAACNANKQDKTEVETSNALNPVHGAPGHRCEIAVGAPLSSAPAVGSAPLAPQPQMTPQTPTVPTPTTPAINGSGAKLNPEHGLPGHNCDLPVGAPLT